LGCVGVVGVHHLVAGGDVALIVHFSAGPEEAAGDHVEIAGIGNGFIVMADGGAENAGAVIVVDPDANVIVGVACAVLVVGLAAAGEGLERGEELNVVVKFLVNGGPTGEAAHDWEIGIDDGDGDGQLGAVAAGLEAEEVKPQGALRAGVGFHFGIADAIAVIAAVKDDAGNAGAMGGEDGFDDFRIVDVGSAFVVDDDVVALAVISVAIDREGGLGGGVVRVDDVHFDIGAGFEALFEDALLLGVIMAASAGEEKGAERGGILRANCGRGGCPSKKTQRGQRNRFVHAGMLSRLGGICKRFV